MLSLDQQQQQQPQHKLERRYRSQSAESVTASLGMRGGGGEKQVYISNAGIRLRMVPNQRRGGGSLLLHRSPLVSKILESMTAKCEEQFSASRGQMSRSSR